MEYMLSVKENTIFGFSRDTKMQSNGYIEYFDTANPFGLLKLNFIMMSTNPQELKLFPMGITEDFTKLACNKAIDTFEELEKKIIEQGVLPSTAVIVGINFFTNHTLNIQEQIYRFYVYPNKPRSYCVRIPRGMTKYLFRGDNVERPHRNFQQRPQPQNSNEDKGTQQRQPVSPKKDFKKKPHNKPNHQQPVALPPVDLAEIPDDKLDTVVNGNLGAPIYQDVAVDHNAQQLVSDDAMANAVASLESVVEDNGEPGPDTGVVQTSEEDKGTITLTTDTGISENFSQHDYDAAVAASGGQENETELPPDQVVNG